MTGQLSSIPFRSCVIIGSCARYIPTRISVSIRPLISRAVAQIAEERLAISQWEHRVSGVRVFQSSLYLIHIEFTSGAFRKASQASTHVISLEDSLEHILWPVLELSRVTPIIVPWCMSYSVIPKSTLVLSAARLPDPL